MTTLQDVGSFLGWPFGHFFFWLSQLHGHGSWLEGEVAVSISFVLKFIPLKELFTPWTMKSSQGPMKFRIGF
jgi:hypothetical protein